MALLPNVTDRTYLAFRYGVSVARNRATPVTNPDSPMETTSRKLSVSPITDSSLSAIYLPPGIRAGAKAPGGSGIAQSIQRGLISGGGEELANSGNPVFAANSFASAITKKRATNSWKKAAEEILAVQKENPPQESLPKAKVEKANLQNLQSTPLDLKPA